MKDYIKKTIEEWDKQEFIDISYDARGTIITPKVKEIHAFLRQKLLEAQQHGEEKYKLLATMKIYNGESGLNQSWQEPFKKEIPCKKCGGNARIMFVGMEGKEDNFICNLHENEKGKYWLHDACAVAVYLCEKCFEANAEINQA